MNPLTLTLTLTLTRARVSFRWISRIAYARGASYASLEDNETHTRTPTKTKRRGGVWARTPRCARAPPEGTGAMSHTATKSPCGDTATSPYVDMRSTCSSVFLHPSAFQLSRPAHAIYVHPLSFV